MLQHHSGDGHSERGADALFGSLHAALAAHLSADAPIRTIDDLEHALVAFVLEIGSTVIGSADSATVFALGSVARAEPSGLDAHTLSSAPEEAIAERLARFSERGLLDITDARLAADHFNALTTLLAYSNQPDPALADSDAVRASMTAGVHAFIRADAAPD